LANHETIEKLREIVETLKKSNKESLFRESVGEESLLKSSLPQLLEIIIKKGEFAIQNAHSVYDTTVSQAENRFRSIFTALKNQAERNNQEYVANGKATINQVENLLRELEQYWPPFVTAAVESSGLLEQQRIQEELQQMRTELHNLSGSIKESANKQISQISEQATNTISEVQKEATKIVEEARQEAEKIVERARQTARKISVKEAQTQFKDAQSWFRAKVFIWGMLSALLIGAFIWLAYHYATVHLPEQMQWHIVYHTAIRLTILTAVGAATTFCLRLFRSHLHMNELNLHRQRVANSIAAFVESASTPDQRDLILAKLVEAVINFGNPGLVSADSDIVTVPMVTIDAITKTLRKD